MAWMPPPDGIAMCIFEDITERESVDSQTKCDTGYVRGRHGNEIQPPQP
jgi:hypothetical protein